MKSRDHYFVFLALFLMMAATVAFAADKAAKPSTHTVNLVAPTRVGDVVLPQGEYRVRHIMEGDQHVMEFVPAGGSKSKNVARVNCKLVPLSAKAQQSEVRYKLGDNQERILTGLVFKGDQEEHSF